MYCYVGHHIQSLAKLSVGCWLTTHNTKANYGKQDTTAVPFKSYHILFPTVSTQSSMLSIFHASCCISLILWCTLFSWHGRSSGPEALKEECGMGKSEQSQVTKLIDVLTHNLLLCQADMHKQWQWHQRPKHFVLFFWFKRNEANTKLMWIQGSQYIIYLGWYKGI